MNVSQEIQPQHILVFSLEMQTRNRFDGAFLSWVGVVAAPVQFLKLRGEATSCFTMAPYALGILSLVAGAGTVVLFTKVFY